VRPRQVEEMGSRVEKMFLLDFGWESDGMGCGGCCEWGSFLWLVLINELYGQGKCKAMITYLPLLDVVLVAEARGLNVLSFVGALQQQVGVEIIEP
jgi:hypothetical protein